MGFIRRVKRVGRAVTQLFLGRRRKAVRAPKRRKRFAGKQTGMLTVKKTVIDDRIIVNSGTTQFGSDTFELADLPQYGDYINLYEEFRIDKIVYSFKALVNQSLGTPVVGSLYVATLGMVHTNVDHNDATAPTSIQSMMNDPTYRGTSSNRHHTRVIKPRWLNTIGGAFQGQSKTGWLNCQDPSGNVNPASHYALKWAFQGGYNNSPLVTPFSFMLEPIITYYVSFRNPK